MTRASGELVRSFEHAGIVVSVAFSNDGRHVLSARDKTSKLWDAASGQLVLVHHFEGHCACGACGLH